MFELVVWGALIAPILLYSSHRLASKDGSVEATSFRFEVAMGLCLAFVYLLLGATLVGGGSLLDRLAVSLSAPFQSEYPLWATFFVFGTPFGWLSFIGGLAALIPQRNVQIHRIAYGLIWVGAVFSTLSILTFLIVDFE